MEFNGGIPIIVTYTPNSTIILFNPVANGTKPINGQNTIINGAYKNFCLVLVYANAV